MRWIILSLSVTMLGACSTTPEPVSMGQTAQAGSKGEGSCALYGWTTDEKREFVFYADAKTARYDTSDGPIDLVAEDKFPSLAYSDPSGGRVELRLGDSEAMTGGIRFPTARIVTQTEDGWERLRPVALVQNCQVK